MTTTSSDSRAAGLGRKRIVEAVMESSEMKRMPALCAAAIRFAIAAAVIMVPVGLAGLATSTPAGGAWRWAAIRSSGVIAQRRSAVVSIPG